MSERRDFEEMVEGIDSISVYETKVVEGILDAIDDDAEIVELKADLRVTLLRVFANCPNLGRDDVLCVALRIADKMVYNWMAILPGEKKIQVGKLMKRLFEQIETTEAGFADMDQPNEWIRTIIRSVTWKDVSKEKRRGIVAKFFDKQIGEIVATLTGIAGDEPVELEKCGGLGDEIVSVLAEMDYVDLVSAEIVSVVVVEVVKAHFGVMVNFCVGGGGGVN